MSYTCNDKCSNCSSYILPGAPCVNCSEGTPCQTIYNSSCVIYTGNCLECYGVQSGDTLTTVIDKLLEFVYPQCTTTTSTTTSLSCSCPDGYDLSLNGLYCERILQSQPLSMGSQIIGNGYVSPIATYGSLGVRIYNLNDYDLSGNSISNTYAYTNSNSFWNNRMNQSIIWKNGNQCWPGNVYTTPWLCTPFGENNTPYPGVLGICNNITVNESKNYYIGIGGDNAVIVKINGTVIISQPIPVPANTSNFNYWHIYPITLNSGVNTVEVLNINVSIVGGFAAEIYDNTLLELSTATNISSINKIFTTEIYRTGGSSEGEQFCNAYTCPDGYIYDGNIGMCIKIETTNCIGITSTTSTTTDGYIG